MKMEAKRRWKQKKAAATCLDANQNNEQRFDFLPSEQVAKRIQMPMEGMKRGGSPFYEQKLLGIHPRL